MQWCSVHIVECICGPTMMTASPRFIFMKRKALNNGGNNSEGASYLFVCCFDLGFRLFACPYPQLALQTPIIVDCICGPTMMTAIPRFIFITCKVLHNLVKSFLKRHPAYSGFQALWLSCIPTKRFIIETDFKSRVGYNGMLMDYEIKSSTCERL